MPKPKRLLASAVLRTARGRLSIIGDKELNENLEMAADNMAEAFRIGAQEAQAEIVRRLTVLAVKP